jgi:hypothetical protein
MYQTIPHVNTWKSDSKILIGSRTKDRFLTRIDNLVKALGTCADEGEKTCLQAELYFATNYWLRNFRRNRSMSSGRESTVRDLFRCNARVLAKRLSHGSVQTLPNFLEFHFGRKMELHSYRTDVLAGAAIYMSRAQIEKYRLSFEHDGRAFQIQWWADGKREHADTSLVYPRIGEDARNGMRADWAFVVMSMSHDIYMGPHVAAEMGAKTGFYHSTYLSGKSVLFAGSMLIVDGWVKAVRPDSGHYKPSEQHAVNLLKHLKLLGVPINDLEYWDFAGEKSYDALDVLKWNGDVEKLMYDIGKSNQKQNWERITDVQKARLTWERVKSMKVDIRTVTNERYLEMVKQARLTSPTIASDDLDYIWDSAYIEVLLDLAMFDVTFQNQFEEWYKARPKRVS